MPNRIPTQKDLATMAWESGGELFSAGHALEDIADLLGADASEHGLTTKETEVLLHAVHAIGTSIKFWSERLSEAGELGGGMH